MEPVRLQMAPHTKAKHSILERYLKGWFPIMSRWNGKIVYLDGFSGSGIYNDGSPGSPIIALRVARDHFQRSAMRSGEKIFYFVEKDPATFATLNSVIETEFGRRVGEARCEKLQENFRVYTENGDFNIELAKVLDGIERDKSSLAPTFAFIDPFAYSLNMEVISRILAYPRCEVFLTFMVGFLNRFIFADEHLEPIKRTFGIDEDRVRNIREIADESERETELGKILIEILKSRIPVGTDCYWLSFKMLDQQNRSLYWLVYFTKNKKGMQVMKDSMFEIGGQGEYRFSDFYFDAKQKRILDYSTEEHWPTQAARYLYQKLRGRTMGIDQVKDFVLLQTPYIYRAKILNKLEDEKKIDVSLDRRRTRGTYPPGSLIRFL